MENEEKLVIEDEDLEVQAPLKCPNCGATGQQLTLKVIIVDSKSRSSIAEVTCKECGNMWRTHR